MKASQEIRLAAETYNSVLRQCYNINKPLSYGFIVVVWECISHASVVGIICYNKFIPKKSS